MRGLFQLVYINCRVMLENCQYEEETTSELSTTRAFPPSPHKPMSFARARTHVFHPLMNGCVCEMQAFACISQTHPFIMLAIADRQSEKE